MKVFNPRRWDRLNRDFRSRWMRRRVRRRRANPAAVWEEQPAEVAEEASDVTKKQQLLDYQPAARLLMPIRRSKRAAVDSGSAPQRRFPPRLLDRKVRFHSRPTTDVPPTN